MQDRRKRERKMSHIFLLQMNNTENSEEFGTIDPDEGNTW
jgi:hypothetical protein